MTPFPLLPHHALFYMYIYITTYICLTAAYSCVTDCRLLCMQLQLSYEMIQYAYVPLPSLPLLSFLPSQLQSKRPPSLSQDAPHPPPPLTPLSLPSTNQKKSRQVRCVARPSATRLLYTVCMVANTPHPSSTHAHTYSHRLWCAADTCPGQLGSKVSCEKTSEQAPFSQQPPPTPGNMAACPACQASRPHSFVCQSVIELISECRAINDSNESANHLITRVIAEPTVVIAPRHDWCWLWSSDATGGSPIRNNLLLLPPPPLLGGAQ